MACLQAKCLGSLECFGSAPRLRGCGEGFLASGSGTGSGSGYSVPDLTSPFDCCTDGVGTVYVQNPNSDLLRAFFVALSACCAQS